MKVRASFVADTDALELVHPGEGALDNPAHLAEAGALSGTASGDQRFDAALPEQAAVLVEVVAPVGIHPSGLVARSSSQAPDRRDSLQQREELGDVVAVATGERDGEWGAVPVNDQMVLRTGTRAVDRRGPDVIPPFRARTCEPSTAQSSGSSRSARRNSDNRAACNLGQRPASVQSRSRRHAVTPEQPTASVGTSRQATPVRSTYMTPARAARSGTRSRPG